MKNKSRKQKQFEYEERYGEIPIDYNERLNWMYEKYKLSDKKAKDILDKRMMMLNSLYYNDINLVLFEVPEGTPRPRFRIINRNNFAQAAISSPNFVHVYSPNAKEDKLFMKRLVEYELQDLDKLNGSLISTPILLEYYTYYQTPNAFNIEDKFLAEIGLVRPLAKPDWDNYGKKYSDMTNENIWLDDSFVIEGTVKKFFSILPRIEIKIKYLNLLYNKYQYNNITKRKDFISHNCNVDYFRGDK